jgi:hypothetical protein
MMATSARAGAEVSAASVNAPAAAVIAFFMNVVWW